MAVFNYAGNHAVDEVNEQDYNACSSSSVIKSHTGGSTSIPLTTTGPRYFICPTAGHCASGMKLRVNVLAASGTPSPPSPTPPANTPPSPTPPANTPPSPTPPSPSAAAPAFLNLNHLIFGASVAFFATLFVLWVWSGLGRCSALLYYIDIDWIICHPCFLFFFLFSVFPGFVLLIFSQRCSFCEFFFLSFFTY